jgi:outer membrane receptor protein involved in Fe transport
MSGERTSDGRISRFPRRSSVPHWPVLLLLAAFLIICLVWSRALAASDNSGPGVTEAEIEEIVVTGSRIRRRDFETPTPLSTITSDALAFSGQATLEEVLNQMPQVMPRPGRASNSSENNAGIGAAEVDLRGLGSGRSLVLLNGRRIAPSGLGNSVNLNVIPQFLINRVEIITGGASAVYGSDAIAGAVNFITKQDYTGFGVETSFSTTERGDAETFDVNLAYGHDFASGRGNITLYGNFYERQPLLASEREHTRIWYMDNWFTGVLVEARSIAGGAGTITFPPADLGNGPTQVTFDADGTPLAFVLSEDGYNFAEVNYLQVPMTRVAAGVMGHHDINNDIEAYLEASFSTSEPEQNQAPTPAFLFAAVNIDNPFLSPEAQQLFTDYYVCDPNFGLPPNIGCVAIARRLLEMGPRYKANESDYTRLVAGLRGDIGGGWQFDGWVSYTELSSTDFLRNDASESRVLQGLLVDPATNQCYDPGDGCVPLNLFGEGNLSPEGIEFIRFPDYQNVTERTQKEASVFVTGSPIDTWAGPLDTAFGVTWRSDEIFYKADDLLFTGDALGFFSESSVVGVEEVIEVYGEAVVPLASGAPLADYLGLEIGVRYSDYRIAGGTWTYKAGGVWQPMESLRLRAMHQRSVRAPNATELFESQRQVDTQIVWDSWDDPCSSSRDPVGSGNAEKCILQGLPADQIGIFEATPYYTVKYLFGGNPELAPETGDTWTVGTVISPERLPNWTFSVDYYSLDVTDAIGKVDMGSVCFDSSNTSNVFCDNIRRDATGNIVEVVELTSNAGRLEATGIDTQVQYSDDSLSANVYWTHLLSSKIQENPATKVFECAGYYGWPCTFIENAYAQDRVTTNLHYSTEPWDFHLTWRWIAGSKAAVLRYVAESGFPGEPKLAIPSIGDENYLDVGAARTFGEIFTARVGVTNLLDNDPPHMANYVTTYNTDPGLYDVFGRSYYLTISAEF